MTTAQQSILDWVRRHREPSTWGIVCGNIKALDKQLNTYFATPGTPCEDAAREIDPTFRVGTHNPQTGKPLKLPMGDVKLVDKVWWVARSRFLELAYENVPTANI